MPFPRPPGLAGLLALPALAAAQAQPLEGATPEPLWEFGAGVVAISQQAYPGSDQHVNRALPLPLFVYRGDLLRADREAVGLRAVRLGRFELDLGFSGALGSSSSEIDERRGMPDLGTLFEFGPRARWLVAEPAPGARWRVELPWRGVFDLSDSLAYRGVTVEPELQFDRRWADNRRFTASIAAVFGNERINDLFFEVAPEYATPERRAYDARAGLIAWRLGASLTWPAGRDWRLFGFARLDSVARSVNRSSPLVRQTHGLSGGVAASWTWLRSESVAVD